MKEFKNVDEYMDYLEKRAAINERLLKKFVSQLFYDYMDLKKWYIEKYRECDYEMPEEITLAYRAEARSMLHAMSDKELQRIAAAHDGLAVDVLAKRQMENAQQTTYTRKLDDVIAELEGRFAVYNQQQ